MSMVTLIVSFAQEYQILYKTAILLVRHYEAVFICDIRIGDIGERRCMTRTSCLTPFDGMQRVMHFCDVSHLQHISNDGGRALLHLTDLQNLRKNPIFLRDLIPSDCAPALSKITLRGSGGPVGSQLLGVSIIFARSPSDSFSLLLGRL